VVTAPDPTAAGVAAAASPVPTTSVAIAPAATARQPLIETLPTTTTAASRSHPPKASTPPGCTLRTVPATSKPDHAGLVLASALTIQRVVARPQPSCGYTQNPHPGSMFYRTSVLPWIMDDLQPIGPTRHYVIVFHDGRRIDVDAEAMWPAASSLEFWATVEVIGPRQVCVRRIAASEVKRVEREDGAVWSA
jgi:hypothetical protein